MSLFIVFAAGLYFLADLRKLQEGMAAHERQTALQAAADPQRIDDALRQHPQNRLLQLVAMATKTTEDTDAAIDKLSNDIVPSGVAKPINLGTASRDDLEALRRDLKTAEANATTALPRYAALLKAERDTIEPYARAHGDRDAVGRLLGSLDKRHADITALVSRLLPARADYYRAYDNYVAVLVKEFGTYKIDNGQFVFPFQLAVNRYNAAAQAMTAAAARVGDLERDRKSLLTSQQERWAQLVSGK
ncbi:MAG TPA: hypothetical protein VII39_14295 [Bradyrhizobium sp.]